MSESQNQEHLTNFQSNLLRKWNLQLEKRREPTYSLTLCASVCLQATFLPHFAHEGKQLTPLLLHINVLQFLELNEPSKYICFKVSGAGI